MRFHVVLTDGVDLLEVIAGSTYASFVYCGERWTVYDKVMLMVHEPEDVDSSKMHADVARGEGLIGWVKKEDEQAIVVVVAPENIDSYGVSLFVRLVNADRVSKWRSALEKKWKVKELKRLETL